MKAFIAAALTEIAGCYCFWAWTRLGKSAYWLIPGILSLCLFAYTLTLVESDYAGRAYAAYGAIYIAISLLWMWVLEGNKPTFFDLTGALLCLFGSIMIYFAPKMLNASF